MKYYENWIKDWMEINKVVYEQSVRNVDIVQQQTMKTVDFNINSFNVISDEIKKGYQSWVANVNQVNKLYQDVVQDGVGTWMNQVNTVVPTKKSK